MQLTEMRARRRQTQRPGKRGAHGPPPYLFRDAGQFLLWRLLQEGGHRLCLGVSDQGSGAGQEPPVCVRVHRRRRSRRHLASKGGGPPRAHLPFRRKGQLLVHGRHRPLRPLLGDLLRPGTRGGLRQSGVRRWLRLRPLYGDMEQRLHAVRPVERRRPDAAPQAVGGHRHGAGADLGGYAGGYLQLRYRPFAGDHQARGTALGEEVPGRRQG